MANLHLHFTHIIHSFCHFFHHILVVASTTVKVLINWGLESVILFYLICLIGIHQKMIQMKTFHFFKSIAATVDPLSRIGQSYCTYTLSVSISFTKN